MTSSVYIQKLLKFIFLSVWVFLLHLHCSNQFLLVVEVKAPKSLDQNLDTKMQNYLDTIVILLLHGSFAV